MTDLASHQPSAGNGDLPAAREAVIEQAHRLHQEVAHERDTLRIRVAELSTKISGLEAQLAIAELEASQQRSRTETAMTVRDEAVARRASVEAVLSSMLAIGRAFEIQNEPLVRPSANQENINAQFEAAFNRNAARNPDDGSAGNGGRE